MRLIQAKGQMADVYIGDGVYLRIEEDQVILMTSDGIEITNKIVLTPHTLSSLLDFLARRKAENE